MTRARSDQARPDAESRMIRAARVKARPDAERAPSADASPSDLVEQIRDGGLLAADRPLIVLFSGGQDSTCLLDVAVRIANPELVQALHINFGLREAADQDEEHCRMLCRSLAVRLHTRRVGAPATGNVQAWARHQRYQAAAELAEPIAANVAAGHTATDQVETILYRLASSPSRRALLGMAPREGNLIRPLLPFTREQTAGHCRARGLPWREDESNQSDAYARARIRARLVPALRELHPAAEENVLALSATLRDEAEVLNDLVDQALAGGREIDLETLRRLPPALRRLIVQRLADEAVGRPAPGTARRADEVAALGRDAALDLPHGVRAVVTRGILRFTGQPARGAGGLPPRSARARRPASL